MSTQTLWLKARWAGVCDRCDRPYRAGTRIRRDATGGTRAWCCSGEVRRVA